MKLYSFFRSGTSHRLRIALNLKRVKYNYVAIDLRQDEQTGVNYRTINPQALVPTLELDNGRIIIQSPAIIEWLEECYPDPPLLPQDTLQRAQVRALAAIIGCDIHPINNRRVLQALRNDLAVNESAIQRWCIQWITLGFEALDVLLSQDDQRSTSYCYGSTPTLADVYLIPQIESARRFGVDMAQWPRLLAIDEACGQIEAFRAGAPLAQPDV